METTLSRQEAIDVAEQVLAQTRKLAKDDPEKAVAILTVALEHVRRALGITDRKKSADE